MDTSETAIKKRRIVDAQQPSSPSSSPHHMVMIDIHKLTHHHKQPQQQFPDKPSKFPDPAGLMDLFDHLIHNDKPEPDDSTVHDHEDDDDDAMDIEDMDYLVDDETLHLSDVRDVELIEILLRLPVDSVHRFMCVSSRWFALISDPSFVKRYIQLRDKHLHKSEQFVLYKVCRASNFNSGVFGGLALSRCDDNDYLISSSRLLDFSFSFLPVVRDRPGELHLLKQYCISDFRCLGHSHGLVLCKARYRKSLKPCFKRSLYVCNPLTRKWLELPQLMTRCDKDTGATGFICYSLEDSEPNLNIGFTVVEVEVKERGCEDFYTRVFSSRTGCWEMYHLACLNDLSWSEDVMVPKMIVCNGMFYWDGRECVVEYDPLNEPDKCSFISYPPELGVRRYIHASEGKLREADYHLNPSFSLWELTDRNEGAWHLIYVVHFSRLFDGIGYFSRTDENIVCFRNWSVGKLMLYDMKNASSQGVFQIPFEGKKPDSRAYGSALPFVMTPWPTAIPQLPQKDQASRAG